ncbi:MAG: transcription initiation protein [Alphaproteobacteria bacterium]|nr:transcription initiation protein [Alphaproteobacteria bacterium]
MADFLLLLHRLPHMGPPPSPGDFSTMLQAYMGWTDRMRAEGRHLGGNKLADDGGKMLSATNGRVTVTDGPYVESKEIVGGYYMISARDYAEACRIAETCPHLTFGGRIEVRQVDNISCQA